MYMYEWALVPLPKASAEHSSTVMLVHSIWPPAYVCVESNVMFFFLGAQWLAFTRKDDVSLVSYCWMTGMRFYNTILTSILKVAASLHQFGCEKESI